MEAPESCGPQKGPHTRGQEPETAIKLSGMMDAWYRTACKQQLGLTQPAISNDPGILDSFQDACILQELEEEEAESEPKAKFRVPALPPPCYCLRWAAAPGLAVHPRQFVQLRSAFPRSMRVGADRRCLALLEAARP